MRAAKSRPGRPDRAGRPEVSRAAPPGTSTSWQRADPHRHPLQLRAPPRRMRHRRRAATAGTGSSPPATTASCRGRPTSRACARATSRPPSTPSRTPSPTRRGAAARSPAASPTSPTIPASTAPRCWPRPASPRSGTGASYHNDPARREKLMTDAGVVDPEALRHTKAIQCARAYAETPLSPSPDRILLAHPVALRDPNFRRTVGPHVDPRIRGRRHGRRPQPAARQAPRGAEGRLRPRVPSPRPRSSPGAPSQTGQLILAAWQSREDAFQLHFGIDPEKAAQMLADGIDAACAPTSATPAGQKGQLESELKPAERMDRRQPLRPTCSSGRCTRRPLARRS
jgi:hypothetical protein